MRADKLFEPFSFERNRGALSSYDLNVTDVVSAPEDAGANTLYVCLKTPVRDGHSSAAAAYARGCRLFLAQRGLGLPEDAAVYITEDPEAYLGDLAARCFGYPARSMTVFGITGTHGKSSVIRLALDLLSGAGKSVAALTTDAFFLGDVVTPIKTAPTAADIQRMLRAARRKKVEFVLLEFSAYMLAHHSEKAIPFAALLCTSLSSRASVRGLYRDTEAYRAATQKLFDAGAPLGFLPAGLSVPCAVKRCVTFGDKGDIGVENPYLVQIEPPCTAFSLTFDGQRETVFYPCVGLHAAQNAAAATALALAAGMSLGEIAEGFFTASTPYRLECVCEVGGARIFLDNAFEAEDLTYALSSLRRITPGRFSVVLGSVGGRAFARRAPLGKAAVTGADFAYFTADDPDSEPVPRILRDMVADVADTGRFLALPSRYAALCRAAEELRAGDTLLVLGKAYDETQLISGVSELFSDKEVLLDAVRRR